MKVTNQKQVSQNGLIVVADLQNKVQSNYATQVITTVEGKTFLDTPTLHQEVFGPFSMVVQCKDTSQLEKIISKLEGQLTGTVISDENEVAEYSHYNRCTYKIELVELFLMEYQLE